MITELWHSLPEGALKSWVREKVHNRRQGRGARFWRDGAVYVIETAGFTMRTAEPCYEVPQLIDQFEQKHKIGAGEVVFDAGAFGGILTNVFAKQVGPEGRVISFEPDALNRAHVLKNLELNGGPANVEVLSEGLWDSETEVEFCERGALGSSAFWDGPGGHKVKIQTTTIDRVAAQRKLTRLDFIKINIEGAEVKALNGAIESIRRFRPHFAICTDHYLDGNLAAGVRTCETVEAFLRQRNYTVETRILATQEWVTYGTPPA